MIRLLILGHGQPVKRIIDSLNKDNSKVVNVEQDKVREGEEQTDFENYLTSKGILLNKFKTLKTSDYNLVFVINYNKIIDVGKFSADVRIINLHMGLLPKYRGNNANAWAVINGERTVGYTLHEVSNVLDGGDIYYSYKYDISKDDSYFPAKNAIELDIEKNISKVLNKIYKNELLPVSQKDSSFIYCVKLRPSDGNISDWDVSSDFLIKKNYVFGKPLGTGLKFQYQKDFFSIDKISLIKYFEPSIGIAGSIIYINENKLWVKTGDTAVELSGIRYQDDLVDVKKIFRIGMRL